MIYNNKMIYNLQIINNKMLHLCYYNINHDIFKIYDDDSSNTVTINQKYVNQYIECVNPIIKLFYFYEKTKFQNVINISLGFSNKLKDIISEAISKGIVFKNIKYLYFSYCKSINYSDLQSLFPNVKVFIVDQYFKDYNVLSEFYDTIIIMNNINTNRLQLLNISSWNNIILLNNYYVSSNETLNNYTPFENHPFENQPFNSQLFKQIKKELNLYKDFIMFVQIPLIKSALKT